MAMNPRTAPTTINTVPSGREEVRMNGASAVGGTVGATTLNAPERVGRPVSAPPAVCVPPPVIEIAGTDPVVAAADPPPVIFPVGDGPVDVPVILLVPELVGAEVAVSADFSDACDDNASDRFGGPSAVCCANVENANRDMAAAESSGNRENFIVRGLVCLNECVPACSSRGCS